MTQPLSVGKGLPGLNQCNAFDLRVDLAACLKLQGVPRFPRYAGEELVAGPVAAEPNRHVHLIAFVEVVPQHPRAQAVEDRAFDWPSAREAHVGCAHADATKFTDRPCNLGDQEGCATQRDLGQSIGRVMRLDPGVEADRRLGHARQRQCRIALHIGQQSGCDHTATLDEHDVVRQTLDLAEVVRDVKNRDGKRRVQLLKIREDVFLGERVERSSRREIPKSSMTSSKRISSRAP